MPAARPVTSLHVTLALVLAMVAVLLAAGCAGPQAGDGMSAGNWTLATSVITPPVTTIPTLGTLPVKPECPFEEKIPNSVVSGDPFYYHTQNRNLTTAVNRIWLFGPKTATMFWEHPDTLDKANITISGYRTDLLTNGTYELLFEFPENPDHFNLNLNNRNHPDWILNENGNLVLDLSVVRQEGIKSRDAADILEKAILTSGNGQIVERTTMNVTEAWIQIEPVGNHTFGEKFFLNMTTNLAVGDEIALTPPYPVDFKQTARQQEWAMDHYIPPVYGVKKGSCGVNTVSIEYSSLGHEPKEYRVEFEAVKQDAYASERFFISVPSTPDNPSDIKNNTSGLVTAP